jgi:hypothetical protein
MNMDQNTFANGRNWLQIASALAVGLIFFTTASAQDGGLQFPFGNRGIPQRPNIALPPARGATVWSTYLHGYAANRLAAGSYLESAARANLINGHARLAHLEADRAAIKYHVERVTAFFDLQRMNKAYRRELNPLMHERDAKADVLMEDLITDQPEYVLAELDITGRLNWMFVRLTNRLYTDELLNNTEIFGGSKFSQKLSLYQIQHIYVESTERIDGQRIRTELVNTNSGHQELPPVFSMPALRVSADRYIANRHSIHNGLKDENPKTPSFEQWEAIYNSLDRLQRSLSEAIPAIERSIPRAFNDYYSGKRFIKSQAAAMMHVHRTGQGEQLIGGEVFDGQSIGELLNFMVHRGLQFGRPESGGRSSYEMLFRMLRAAYMNE